ncbi:MAG: nucleoside triphosphate pyrophosphohydrolase [Kiritimatiellae bacterium]|nr:nucleoside triphosphate pyrophosphohydrolase [Kiritimatiellia bacterium]
MAGNAICQAGDEPPAVARMSGIERLCSILARLRGPDGCPWDREQTLESLKTCLLEETYELLDVMSGADRDAHAEELGDVLLQVALQARLREEAGDFNLDDVARRLSDKLIRRHPHVFGEAAVAGTDEVLRNWERIKRDECGRRAAPRSALEGVPAALPALLRAQRVQAKAARVGFDWPDRDGPERKLAEELDELRVAVAAGERAAMAHEMGDVLFSLVNLCRFLEIDAEEALRGSVLRFSSRFRAVEQHVHASGREMRDHSLAELDAIWERVKRESATASAGSPSRA